MAAPRTCLWLLAVFTGSALCSLVIEPQNPVVRPGQRVQLMCKSNSPIAQCLWEINEELYNPGVDRRFRSVGDMQNGECGVEAEVTEADNGKWQCRVFAGAGNALRAATNVTVLVLPKISLRPNADPITATSGQEAEVTCTVSDARPAPAIIWMIGEREIEAPNRQTVDTPRRDGFHTITDTLRHSFEPRDHEQSLRCVTTGPWLTPEDLREASARLNVFFPPQPKDVTTLYGFVAGQSGDVIVNFTANPKPKRVYWSLGEGVEIEVEPAGGRAAPQGYETSELKQISPSTYEARLRIRSVSQAEARRNYRLVVVSDSATGEEQTQEYTVRVSLSSAPAQTGGIGGGAIAGIIIAVLAVFVIVAAVLYARNTGRWCFAGGRRTVGEGESQARIDEENPGEITKDKEGKEGPLKGSTEHLNLELATQNNTTENGNTMPPSPVKDAQQNGGGSSPTKDGKDTPV